MPKPVHLFRLYESGHLPSEGGFILSASFDPNGSIYTILEIISYANVKELISDGQTLTFRSDGYKIYLLVEPNNYLQRSTEPVFRDKGKSIPYRFGELNSIKDYRQNRILIGKEPILSMSSFTVDQPTGENLCIFIYRTEDVEQVMKDLVTNILNKDLQMPRSEARKAANMFCEPILKVVKV